MIPNSVAEQLLEGLERKARERHDSGVEVIPGMDFDKFIQAVRRVGELSVELLKGGSDFAHVGMALDYYSRAIKYMIDEDRRQEGAVDGRT